MSHKISPVLKMTENMPDVSIPLKVYLFCGNTVFDLITALCA